MVQFLEENENINDELFFALQLPDGRTFDFTMPVMKYWKYSTDELKEKKMYALLPLQVFKLRKSITAIYRSKRSRKEKAQLINEEFEKLANTIKTITEEAEELYNSKEILGVDLETILVTLTNISRYLYKKYGAYKKIDEEVDTMMTTLYNPVLVERVEKETTERVTKEIVERVAKEHKEMVKNMLLKDIPENLIIEITKISVEQLEELKKEIKNM